MTPKIISQSTVEPILIAEAAENLGTLFRAATFAEDIDQIIENIE